MQLVLFLTFQELVKRRLKNPKAYFTGSSTIAAFSKNLYHYLEFFLKYDLKDSWKNVLLFLFFFEKFGFHKSTLIAVKKIIMLNLNHALFQ